jgi:GTP cyclohydrolase I
MSYSVQEARWELDNRIEEALHQEDAEALAELSQIMKKIGDDETAEMLKDTLHRINKDDWAYDESINN